MNLRAVFESMQNAINAPESILIKIGIASFVLFSLTFATITLIRNRRIAFIEHSSKAIAWQSKINKKFESLFYANIDQKHAMQRNLNSKKKFDCFNPSKAMFEIIFDNLDSYQDIVSKLESNRKAYSSYLKACDYIFENSPVPDNLHPMLFGTEKTYIKWEQRVFDEKMLSPTIDFAITLAWQYTSPKGRNSYRNSKTFNFDNIKSLLKRAQERQEHERTKTYQRNLMTQSLRYDIMKRDSFRCQICGRSVKNNPNIELEVDHIIPISKGGKTVKSNLQTLCKECNRGKSAKEM